MGDLLLAYNYWEPLHYLQQGTGFQTWEYSPAYSIRSWSYILLHLLPVKVVRAIFPLDKVASHFNQRSIRDLNLCYFLNAAG